MTNSVCDIPLLATSMKTQQYISIGLLLIISVQVFSQNNNIPNTKNSPYFTKDELIIIAKEFKADSLINYLSGKKVAFVTYPSGNRLATKLEYFTEIKEWNNQNPLNDVSDQIIVLTPEEVKNSGGYEIIITYWVKYFTKRQRRKRIKELNKPVANKT